jgi:hypothetical protein
MYDIIDFILVFIGVNFEDIINIGGMVSAVIVSLIVIHDMYTRVKIYPRRR